MTFEFVFISGHGVDHQKEKVVLTAQVKELNKRYREAARFHQRQLEDSIEREAVLEKKLANVEDRIRRIGIPRVQAILYGSD